MTNVTTIITVAVAVIIVVVLIVAVFSLVNSGQSLLSSGKAQVNESVKNYSEISYTQYEGAIVAGSQLASVIKTEWKANNTVATFVCTKDGAIICYDYMQTTYNVVMKGFSKTDGDGEKIVSGFPTDCDGNGITNNNIWGCITKNSVVNNASHQINTEVRDGNNGYSAAIKPDVEGYISPSANYKGSVQRDRNGNVRCMVFVQQ